MVFDDDEIHICVPVAWRRRADPDRGVLVAARAAVPPASGVAPELVLRCSCAPEDDLGRWRARALSELAGLLADFELEDEDDYDLDGQPVAYRRFAHRLGTADVLCDQWAWLVDGVGLTLTCSVAREDYVEYCDVFESVAGSVSIGPRAA